MVLSFLDDGKTFKELSDHIQKKLNCSESWIRTQISIMAPVDNSRDSQILGWPQYPLNNIIKNILNTAINSTIYSVYLLILLASFNLLCNLLWWRQPPNYTIYELYKNFIYYTHQLYCIYICIKYTKVSNAPNRIQSDGQLPHL